MWEKGAIEFFYILDLQGSQTYLPIKISSLAFFYILDLQGSQTYVHFDMPCI